MKGARFVSKYGNYLHIIVPEKASMNFDGVPIVTKKGLHAQFSQEYTTREDIELAVKTFTFAGLPEERGTEQELHPRFRISSFESLTAQELYGWTDEERLLVEETLRNSHENGREFVEVLPEPAGKPWPTYDETPAHEVHSVALATGTVDLALAYERENLNRQDVIVDLEQDRVGEKDQAVLIDAS